MKMKRYIPVLKKIAKVAGNVFFYIFLAVATFCVVFTIFSKKDVDVNAEIIIHYSKGPMQEAEPIAPMETVPSADTDKFSMTVTFSVPERAEEYRLDICQGGTNEVLISKMIAPGSTSTYVELTGQGLVTYDLYVNGEYLETKSIEFTEVE